jgi:hypothetical protein
MFQVFFYSKNKKKNNKVSGALFAKFTHKRNLFSFFGFCCQLQSPDVLLGYFVSFRQELSDEQNLVALN